MDIAAQHPFITIIVLGMVCWLLESLNPIDATKTPRRFDMLTDVLYWFGNSFLRRGLYSIFTRVAILVFFASNISAFWDYFGVPRGLVAYLPGLIQLVLLLLIQDFMAYWLHRGFHDKRLWNFHAVHHAPENLYWLSAIRFHPVNVLAVEVFQVTVLLGLGFSSAAVAGIAPLLLLMAVFSHTNVNWRYGFLKHVFVSPVFHRWHHTREAEGLNKNFGILFSFWDKMFDTWYLPEDKLPLTLGTDTPVPKDIVGQLGFPFAPWVAKIKKIFRRG